MASYDNKSSSDEKTSPAPSAVVEPVSAGHVSTVKRRFKLEVDQEESSFAATKSASNADFDPIPPSKRTWNWGAYVAYWMADAWAVSNWEVGMLLWSRDTSPVDGCRIFIMIECSADTLLTQLPP